MDKILVLIDGANIKHTANQLNINIDWKRFTKPFTAWGNIIGRRYYTAIYEDSQGHIHLKQLVDYLEYNGYTVVQKEAKSFSNTSGEVKIKGNMDLEMAIDALTLAHAKRVDQIILVTGDGDFTCLVRALQQLAIKVVVVSSVKTKPPMVADTLRRAADTFVDLDDLRGQIQRR